MVILAPAGRILVMLPTYNEAGNVVPLTEALLALDDLIDVLVVDDRSPDGTGERVIELQGRFPSRVHLLDRDPPRGRGRAGRDGSAWFQRHPEYALVVEMDADFSHHPRFIPSLLEPITAGIADVVIGSRYVPGGREEGRTWRRQLTSGLANSYLRLVLGTRQRDCTSGFRVFTQKALAGIDFSTYRSVGPTIVTELLNDLLRRKRRIRERPIVFADRTWGESKLSLKILIDSLWFPLALRLAGRAARIGGR
jgi:dolichol-phosphate mannosyltransferase